MVGTQDSHGTRSANTTAQVLAQKVSLKTLFPTMQVSYFVWLNWMKVLWKKTSPQCVLPQACGHGERNEINSSPTLLATRLLLVHRPLPHPSRRTHRSSSPSTRMEDLVATHRWRRLLGLEPPSKKN